MLAITNDKEWNMHRTELCMEEGIRHFDRSTEFDVHNVLNVSQVTDYLKRDGEYFMQPCPAKPGNFFESFAHDFR